MSEHAGCLSYFDAVLGFVTITDGDSETHDFGVNEEFDAVD